ncbi:MAG: hypothetical protein NZO58_11855, partial [Gemmataceae bacterium]|nr:hypothetical protein [Gemmataceae bacterium]
MDDVLASVDRHFPLLFAIAEERNIAAGQRLAAEGAFDLNLRSRGTVQDGSFTNQRFDLALEQATALYGISFFG